MISFTSYLEKNKGQSPTGDRPKSYMPGKFRGVNYTDNSQAIGDVTGGEGGTIGGDEDEELSFVNFLQQRTQAEEEEVTLELKDDSTDDTEESNEVPDGENGDETTPDTPPEGQNDVGGNPDKQGLLRTVPNAHLVYKRQDKDGTYEELWQYEIKKGMRDEYNIRNDILAGTDIPPKGTKSPDGAQSYDMWTAGNMQLLQITGLPN